MKYSGIILASGEGSRMKSITDKYKLPKHLLPLDEKSIIERTIAQLSFCDEIICVTKPELVHEFENKLKHLNVKIVSKTKSGFVGDFEAAYNNANFETIILTVGDLIFPDNEMNKIIKASDEKISLILDKTVIKYFDFRMLMGKVPKKLMSEIIDLNPESFIDVAKRFIKLILKKQVRLDFYSTLFNINTPENYKNAIEYFKYRT